MKCEITNNDPHVMIPVDTLVLMNDEHSKLKLQNARLETILTKHGVCGDCGEMFIHEILTPFAGCKCKQSEGYDLTPYMKLDHRVQELEHERNVLLAKIEEMKEFCLTAGEVWKVGEI